MSQPLAKLDAEIRSLNLGGDQVVRRLLFSVDGVSCGIPYHDGPAQPVNGVNVWHRESGATLNDLTLSPSYHVPGKIHGFVRDGCWVSA